MIPVTIVREFFRAAMESTKSLYNFDKIHGSRRTPVSQFTNERWLLSRDLEERVMPPYI